MHRLRGLKILRSLGLEFWLPLPLVGLLFWFGSGWLTNQQLQQIASKTESLQLNSRSQKRYPRNITEIKIQIESNSSRAIVNTTSSALKTFTLEFPFTQPEQIEIAVGQILGLSIVEVRSLIHTTDQKTIETKKPPEP